MFVGSVLEYSKCASISDLGSTYVMLLAGDKASQKRDIVKALALASDVK
jgi:putative component of toxin-antitoxin plasmid stabilization module